MRGVACRECNIVVNKNVLHRNVWERFIVNIYVVNRKKWPRKVWVKFIVDCLCRE